METAWDIGWGLDLLGKSPGENAVFSTFTAQNILLPKNLILKTPIVCFYDSGLPRSPVPSCNIILTHICAIWWELKCLQTTLLH